MGHRQHGNREAEQRRRAASGDAGPTAAQEEQRVGGVLEQVAADVGTEAEKGAVASPKEWRPFPAEAGYEREAATTTTLGGGPAQGDHNERDG